MNKKILIIIVLLLSFSFCYASEGLLDSFMEKITYLKDWFLEGHFIEEFYRELEELKSELPQLLIKIKDLLPQK